MVTFEREDRPRRMKEGLRVMVYLLDEKDDNSATYCGYYPFSGILESDRPRLAKDRLAQAIILELSAAD